MPIPDGILDGAGVGPPGITSSCLEEGSNLDDVTLPLSDLNPHDRRKSDQFLEAVDVCSITDYRSKVWCDRGMINAYGSRSVVGSASLPASPLLIMTPYPRHISWKIPNPRPTVRIFSSTGVYSCFLGRSEHSHLAQ